VELVRRAESSGYQAIVLTIDSPVAGPTVGSALKVYTATVNRHTWTYVNFIREAETHLSDAEKVGYALSHINPSITWEDVAWFRSITKLPFILKGILNPEDAVKGVEAGAAGILVSNHGGRQLDTTPATLDVLRSVVRAVGGRCEVYLDGGVRTGTDVIKALALGARAVFMGRPVIYALAYNGADGVKEMLDILKAEFLAAMCMSGCASVADINPSLILHQSELLSKV